VTVPLRDLNTSTLKVVPTCPCAPPAPSFFVGVGMQLTISAAHATAKGT
jgi:hypothetical protein